MFSTKQPGSRDVVHLVVSFLSLTSDSLTHSLMFLPRRRKRGRVGNRLAAVTTEIGFKISTSLHKSLPLFFLIINLAFDFAENMRFGLDLKGDDRNPRGSGLHLLHDLVRSFLSYLFASSEGLVFLKMMMKVLGFCILHAVLYFYLVYL